jgi:quercetin dioxygenase-like cupin family protein
MNKLRSNLFTKKRWGSEVVWTLTDNYMAKTVEVVKSKRTPLVVHEEKEKSIIVIRGPLYLTYGSCCNEETVPVYKLPEGWSWYIEPGMIYRYQAIESPVMLIEVSTPQLEDGVVLVDEGGVEIAPTITDVKELVDQAEKEEVKTKKLKKRKRRVKNK